MTVTQVKRKFNDFVALVGSIPSDEDLLVTFTDPVQRAEIFLTECGSLCKGWQEQYADFPLTLAAMEEFGNSKKEPRWVVMMSLGVVCLAFILQEW